MKLCAYRKAINIVFVFVKEKMNDLEVDKKMSYIIETVGCWQPCVVRLIRLHR